MSTRVMALVYCAYKHLSCTTILQYYKVDGLWTMNRVNSEQCMQIAVEQCTHLQYYHWRCKKYSDSFGKFEENVIYQNGEIQQNCFLWLFLKFNFSNFHSNENHLWFKMDVQNVWYLMLHSNGRLQSIQIELYELWIRQHEKLTSQKWFVIQ